jgi:uncharacterized protein (DUF1810 family)
MLDEGREAPEVAHLHPPVCHLRLAQVDDYAQALAESQVGRKTSHWMWYVFPQIPQIHALGFNLMSQRYAIKSVAEARTYLDHPLLGTRLIEIAEVAMRVEGRSARDRSARPTNDAGRIQDHREAVTMARFR